ncbi:MAG: Ryanodine receptor Ryr, partial [Bryobacteraceae bacterium]
MAEGFSGSHAGRGFQSGGIQHSFGKAIFVFAGGTAASLAEFNVKKDDKHYGKFKDAKGPDFISRLRGHIDVKGPNPEKGAAGYAHIIRRAILLRKLLERNAEQLIHSETKQLAMDAGIIRAFLTVKEYFHGARSLEAVVTMSNLARTRFYGLAELPTRDLL